MLEVSPPTPITDPHYHASVRDLCGRQAEMGNLIEVQTQKSRSQGYFGLPRLADKSAYRIEG